MTTTQSLNGTWTARQTKGKLTVPGSVPGCIHTDLLAAGEIADPFYRTQEFDAYWVAESSWEYSRSFTMDDQLASSERIVLHCDGLDTLATIRLNGKEIASTDNMFRTYEFDVTSLLKRGENKIAVLFAPALEYTLRREAERHLPGWNHSEKIGVHGYIRKEQCNFGWDWGIRTVTCGIWRGISLIGYSAARLADVHVTQRHESAKKVALDVAVTTDALGSGELTAEVSVTRNGAEVAKTSVAVSPGATSASLSIKNPELWWPNTMGEQPLYHVTVVLKAGDSEIDRWERNVGLRTIELDRHPDEWGESFQFVVNGVPFFSKGANWIPADAYNNRTTPERYRDLIASAAEANMNMLRVWGGGLYEEDVFYDLCDEYGICIWQDFMFACYSYPTYDEKFLENVAQEAKDNVRRMRHHPSIALWCGNNELEQGLVGPEWTETAMSWDDYVPLFDKKLAEIVSKYDGQTAYWPGSPHTPVGDRANFNDPRSGDAHLWSVWHGKEPFEWYRTCEHRFNSEFGFQSFPEPRTTLGYTAPEDRSVTSYVMEHHQRSGIGNSTIMHYMLDWFRLPTGFEQTLWTSQVLQGMAIKYAVEHWRRSMPRGMGTIYWQLNDTWPVASWSSIDYHHRWKALHYMAKKFFAPLLLSGLEDLETGSVEVHVTNDAQQPRPLLLKWTVTDAKGDVLESDKKQVKTAKSADKKVHTLKLKKLMEQHGSRNLLVWLEAFDGKDKVAENLVLLGRPKHLELSFSPGISTTVAAAEGHSFKVTLTSKAAALWTWITLEETDFRSSDNFVHIRPGQPVTITVTPATRLSAAAFKKQLKVQSLVDLSRWQSG